MNLDQAIFLVISAPLLTAVLLIFVDFVKRLSNLKGRGL